MISTTTTNKRLGTDILARDPKQPSKKMLKIESTRQLLNEELSEVALMLSTPVRLVILGALVQAPRSVEELAEITGQSMANVSQHLTKLKNTRLVTVEKKGVQRVYSLGSPAVQRVVVALQELAREISSDVNEAENLLVDPSLRSQLPLQNILAEVEKRRADLIDVRSPIEQMATPVQQALRIPVESEDDLQKVLKAASKDKPVYVFCRGAYCVTASMTAEFLRKKGIDAWCLRETALEFPRKEPSKDSH